MASTPADTTFSVKFKDVPLTPDQVSAIERAIGETVAEQIALLAIPAETRPLLTPEALPGGIREQTAGLMAVRKEQ